MTDMGAPAGSALAPTAPAPPEGKVFSPEQIDALLGEHRAKASREAVKGLLGELGVESKADLTRIIAERKDAERAAMTEAERLRAEAAEAKAAAEAERAAALELRHASLVERTLIAAGATGNIERLTRLVDAPIGAGTDDIVSAVESVKAEFPALFGEAPIPSAPRPSSEPSAGGPPGAQPTRMNPFERGAEMARRIQGRTA